MNPTSGVIGESFGLYRAHARHFIIVAFVIYAGIAVVSALLAALLGVIGALLSALVSIVGTFLLQAAIVEAVRDVRDGRADLTVGETFRRASQQVSHVAIAGILAGIAIFVGLLLLVVPGLVLLTWWVLIVPVIVLENVSAGDSFGRSRQLVRGNGWQVFGVLVVTLVIALVVDLVCGSVAGAFSDSAVALAVAGLVGGTLTAPLFALASAVMYLTLRARRL
jgi:hypothetical protein